MKIKFDKKIFLLIVVILVFAVLLVVLIIHRINSYDGENISYIYNLESFSAYTDNDRYNEIDDLTSYNSAESSKTSSNETTKDTDETSITTEQSTNGNNETSYISNTNTNNSKEYYDYDENDYSWSEEDFNFGGPYSFLGGAIPDKDSSALSAEDKMIFDKFFEEFYKYVPINGTDIDKMYGLHRFIKLELKLDEAYWFGTDLKTMYYYASKEEDYNKIGSFRILNLFELAGLTAKEIEYGFTTYTGFMVRLDNEWYYVNNSYLELQNEQSYPNMQFDHINFPVANGMKYINYCHYGRCVAFGYRGEIYSWKFDNTIGNASVVTKENNKNSIIELNKKPQFVENQFDSNIHYLHLDGTYGLKLNGISALPDKYTIMVSAEVRSSDITTLLQMGSMIYDSTSTRSEWLSIGIHYGWLFPWSNNALMDRFHVGMVDITLPNISTGIMVNIVIVVTGEECSEDTDCIYAKLYIDGSYIATGKVLKNLFNDPVIEAYVGVNYWDSMLVGNVEAISIFNRALTEDEIKDYYYVGCH